MEYTEEKKKKINLSADQRCYCLQDYQLLLYKLQFTSISEITERHWLFRHYKHNIDDEFHNFSKGFSSSCS